MSTPILDQQELEDYFHFSRTCQHCGKNWQGLHCPHDGYQNPCPNCNKRPQTVPGDIEHCNCEFTVPTTAINLLVKEAIKEHPNDK